MNYEAREFLKMHILVKMERDMNSTPAEVRDWILSSEGLPFNFKEVNPKTLVNFVTFNVKKIQETGNLDRKTGSGCSNALRKSDVSKIKRLALNKKRRSIRKVGAMVGVAPNTVANVLKRAGAKAYHRRKVQAMKPQHHMDRVRFATWALSKYGKVVNGNTAWGRLINTDFRAMVMHNGSLNTKNDIIWSHSIEEAGDLLDFAQEKFEDSFMIWGGVSLKGLIPSTSPIFVCDLKKEWEKLGNPKTRGVTGDIYSFMITKYAVPAVTKLYGQRAVW